ncbi:MAG: hypothetical protein Q8Q23_02230 [bacterium]|nr:hypothetical protein [bacterium]
MQKKCSKEQDVETEFTQESTEDVNQENNRARYWHQKRSKCKNLFKGRRSWSFVRNYK